MVRLIIATYLWAVVMALGVWDYYILRFPPCHLPKIYQEVLMPVVKVRAGNSTGSGVIISHRRDAEKTYILTAAHVVGDEKEVRVYIYEYELPVVTIETATVIITDTNKDLALLRLNPSNLRNLWLGSAKLAPRDYQPYLFSPVWAVGCSLGLPPRPSSGHICAICGSYWEVSAPILPGNSGGGVFLKDTHELIGITVWIRLCYGQLVTTMAGIVPLNQIYEFLKTTPLMNCEEHKSEGLTVGQAGVPSLPAGRQVRNRNRGPGGPTLPMKGGEKSCHK